MLVDAKRRLERKQTKPEEKAPQTPAQLVSKNSQKVVFNRFIQDFTATCQHYDLDEKSVIDLDRATELSRDLGFYNDSVKQNMLQMLQIIKVQNDDEIP